MTRDEYLKRVEDSAEAHGQISTRTYEYRLKCHVSKESVSAAMKKGMERRNTRLNGINGKQAARREYMSQIKKLMENEERLDSEIGRLAIDNYHSTLSGNFYD